MVNIRGDAREGQTWGGEGGSEKNKLAEAGAVVKDDSPLSQKRSHLSLLLMVKGAVYFSGLQLSHTNLVTPACRTS